MHIYRVTHTDRPHEPGGILDAMRSEESDTRVVVFDVSGKFNLGNTGGIRNASLVQRRNVVVAGNTARYGVQITGCPLRIVECESLQFHHISFRLDSAPNADLAKSWAPIRIVADRPIINRDILFSNCSFAGGNDENYVGPANIKEWVKNHPTEPAAHDIHFRNCIFTFPFREHRGENGEPGRHNFNLMLSWVRRGVVDGCVFAHANRRSPQVYGWDCAISNNIIHNYGTMAIGAMGCSMSITNNTFIRGPNTRKTPPVPLIVTESSDSYEQRMDLYQRGNTLENPYRNGTEVKVYENLTEGFQTVEHDENVAKIAINRPVLRAAGPVVLDAWDEITLGRLSMGIDSDVGWVVNQNDLPVPVVHEDRCPVLFPADVTVQDILNFRH